MKSLLLLLLASAAAHAQLQLYFAPPGAPEQEINGVHDLGSVPVADTIAARFRLRNTGAASVTIRTLQVSGAAFGITGQPPLPYIAAPGTNVDFTVHFLPQATGSYSASLNVNASAWLLRATATPGMALRLRGEPVSTGTAIDLGIVERGESATLLLELHNPAREPATVSEIAVSGPAFSLGPVVRPLTLAPGAGAPLELRFSPAAAGIATGTLTIDRRVFRLTGSGTEPALPRPALVLSSGAIRSGEQGRVSVRLAGPSRAHGKGTLRMELQPAGTIRDNDSAAQFATGSRTAAFEIAPGDSHVSFRGEDSLPFQAGTTAGTIVFVVEAGGFTERTGVTVTPEAVRLEKVSVQRLGTALDVQLTGFDNTRTLSALRFTFFAGSQALSGMPLQISAGAEFDRWWSASTLGGVFQLRASFPVTGDGAKISGVEVQVVNSAGTASSDRIAF